MEMIGKTRYIPRIADSELQDRLEASGAVLIVGPKWCGKTTLASHQARSVLSLQDPDRRSSYISTASVKPSLLLKGDKPRLLDEWQTIPVLWDAVRHDVDRSGLLGQYILTGSNAVDEKQILHSGIGRIARMKLYPMSLFETGESNGALSLDRLFCDPNYEIDGMVSSLSVEDLIFATCRGGWPSSLFMTSRKAQLLVPKDYLNGVCETEISTVDGVRRDPAKTRALLSSYARNVSTMAKKTTLLQDINTQDTGMSIGTLDSYLSALERLFVIEDVPAWSPAIRSASSMQRRHKREFVDPSIGIAALGLSPEYFETDLKTFGFFFENLCARDLRVYSQKTGGHLSYYHDRYGLEADFVLHRDDGRYALVECKLGSAEIEEGARHLLEIRRLLEEKIASEKQCPLKVPDLMIVLTGGEMAYRRPDGVDVIPIGCLRD